MKRTAALVLALALVAVMLPGRTLAAARSAAGLAPAEILAKYVAAIGALPRPQAITFDYAVEQLGLKNLEQTHHVYRAGLHERDETLVVDGFALPRPSVRILRNRTYRYDIKAVAPMPATYGFTYSGARIAGDGFSYVFTTQPRAARSFAVSEIEIDGRTFLPTTLRFRVSGAAAHGSGELLYGRAQTYWLVHQAQVNAHLPGGSLAHERIVWSNYQFPVSLPPSTFAPPRANTIVEPLPDVSPTPDPDSP